MNDEEFARMVRKNKRLEKVELLEELRSMSKLENVNGLWFNRKNVTLDGYRFDGCRFDSCNIYVNSGSFELIRCFIDSSNEIHIQSDVVKIIDLWNLSNDNKDGTARQNKDGTTRQNKDGTITIKGV